MPHSFPSDLAQVVNERWTTYVVLENWTPPVLPAMEKLQELFEAVFFASLEREEGRFLRFTTCYTETFWVAREGSSDGAKVIPIMPQRRLSVEALRSLAPAVRADGAAILVRPELEGGAGELQIAGILHIGSDYARARVGKTMVCDHPPHALVVEIRGPGELHVYQGKTKLAVLESGSIQASVAVSALDFAPAADILKKGEKGFWSRITPPEHESQQECLSFQTMALLNTLLNIVNTIKSYGHGGTLLLADPDAVERMPVKIKYTAMYDMNFLDGEFADFINARNAFIDAVKESEQVTEPAQKGTAHIHLLPPLMEAERSLCDAAETIAGLSCVDGALVMSASLRLVGFGAEILLEKAPRATVYQVTGNPAEPADYPEVDSESFGMRHRSAVRFVAATPGTVAFIVSQDGKVSLCWTREGRTYMKRGVNTSNPNMVGE